MLLSMRRPVIYLTTEEPPEDVLKASQKRSEEGFGEDESVRIIDCYSWRTGTGSKSRYFIKNPSNLTEVSIAPWGCREIRT